MRREPDFEVVTLPPGAQLDFTRNPNFSHQLRPVQLCILPEGTNDNKTSFAFVLVDILNRTYVAQISERMLRDACRDAGLNFQLTKHLDDGPLEDRQLGADEEVE